MCFRDGNRDNKSRNNCYFLHICDIMNIIIERRTKGIPEVKLKTSLLQQLEKIGVENEFESMYLQSKHLNFMIIHMDFFYLCYGYFCNHSFMAIRTDVSPDSQVFKSSSFFMNDDHFLNHQMGKISEFNQNERNLATRIMYRTI